MAIGEGDVASLRCGLVLRKQAVLVKWFWIWNMAAYRWRRVAM